MTTRSAVLQPPAQVAAARKIDKQPGPLRSIALWIVVLAFAVRIILMLATHAYDFEHRRVDDFSYVNETTSIARSIAGGRGFSSPFGANYTGPSAWIAPVYPYLCALVFACFGALTTKSAVVLLILQSLFSALTCIPILGIAERTVGRRAGAAAALLWALFPWFSKWALSWIWEIPLSTLLFACLFWYALRLAETARPKLWIGFGALWGFALLVNPALLPLFPASLVWCLVQSHTNLHRVPRSSPVLATPGFFESLRPALLSLTVCLVVISPWLVRHRIVFGEWVFVRSNFGFEFYLGNNPYSVGRGWSGQHPSRNPGELARYVQMGEPAFVRAHMDQALHWVRSSKRDFAILTARRVMYFWDGSAIGYRDPIAWYWLPQSFAVLSFLTLPALLLAHRRRVYAWQLFFSAVLLYPLPYYLTYSQVRYRHALEPLLLLLACSMLWYDDVSRQ